MKSTRWLAAQGEVMPEIAEYGQRDGVGLADLIGSDQVSKEEVEEVARSALELVGADLDALALPPFATTLD